MSDLQINIQEAPALVIEIAGVGVPAGAGSSIDERGVSEATARLIAQEEAEAAVGRALDGDPTNDPLDDLPDLVLLFNNHLV